MAESDCVPPGTEVGLEKSDDTVIKQTDLEKHIETLTVNLDDGSKAKVFTRIGINNHGTYLYNCNICKVSNMAAGSIQMHLNGKKHQSKLLLPVLSARLFYAQIKEIGNKVPELCLAPGEPVPPGFEGEVKGVAELQATLDENKSPLIGLEYLAELIGDQREPQYVCTLCDKRGDPRTVMAHLLSFNHRFWYLETHYPSLHKVLYTMRNNKDYKKVVPTVVQNILEAIEIKFGRNTPFIVDKDVFEGNKEKYYEEAKNDKHFSEKNGPNFMHLVSKHIFEELKSKLDDQASLEETDELSKRKNEFSEKTLPEKKARNDQIDEQKNYDDISSISSSSLSRSRSRSRSRGRQYARSRSRDYNKRYINQRRSRSKTYSPIRFRDRCYRSNNYRSKSRSRSRSSSRNMKSSHKFYDRDLYRKPRRLWETSMSKASYSNYDKSEKRHYQPTPSRLSIDSKRQIAPTPKELVQQASKLSTERYNLEKYRFAVEIMESEMEKVLLSHEKSPEKHPLYPEEWKKFWNRRYKELQSENKDPSKHDFKSEWIKFWTDRMKQLHKEEIENKRIKLREKYNIKENAEEENVRNLKQKFILKVKTPSIIDPNEIIILDDDRNSDRHSIASLHSENKRSSRSIKSASPWDEDDDFDIKSRESAKRTHEPVERNKSYDEWAKEYYGPNKSKTTFIRDLRSTSEVSKDVNYPTLDPSECLNIVSVLRLLTALEDLLGSLGPKIINMLSTALAMEKAKANSAEDLLLNDANNVMFETVKEKLKGQLFAGILESQKVQPVKTAIQKIAALLHQASEKQKINEEEERKALAAKKLEPVTVPGVGSVDKAAIAKQIAVALMAQGKPNVTTDELEQLINAVVGMANASQSSNKPLTTAAYLAQLQNPVENMSANTIELQELEKKDPMDGLSDSDLKTLLQNFSNLSNDEQHGLIMYLKKLESREPERVENLRKFVNVEQFKSLTENKNDKSDQNPGRVSPFSNREGGTNPSSDVQTFSNASRISKSSDENSQKFSEHVIESDDEDYSYEDVFKAASKNVKETQLQKDMKLVRETITRDRESGHSSNDKDMSLIDATSLIANLMSSLHNKSNERSSESTNIRTQMEHNSDNLEQTKARLQLNMSASPSIKLFSNSLEASNSRLNSNYQDAADIRAVSNITDMSSLRYLGNSDSTDRRTTNSFDLNNIRPHHKFSESSRLLSNASDASGMRSLSDTKNMSMQYNNRLESSFSNANRHFGNDREFMQKNKQDNFLDMQSNNSFHNNHYDQNKFRDNFHGQPGQQQYGRSFDTNKFNMQNSMSYGNPEQSRFNNKGSSNLEQQRFNQSRAPNTELQRFSLNNQDYNRPFQGHKFNQNMRFNSRGRYN